MHVLCPSYLEIAKKSTYFVVLVLLDSCLSAGLDTNLILCIYCFAAAAFCLLHSSCEQEFKVQYIELY